MWVTSPLYQQMSNQIQLEKMNKYEEYEFVFFWILKILKCVWMQCYLASWWFYEDLHTQAGQAKISHRISLRTYLYIMYLYIHIIYICMLYINFILTSLLHVHGRVLRRDLWRSLWRRLGRELWRGWWRFHGRGRTLWPDVFAFSAQLI